MARFWEKPLVRNDDSTHAEHRHVTWLELFYDLAFVVAIAVVGHELAKDITPHGLLTFVAYFIPIWWAWLGDAFYNNRYDPEDHGHQLFTMIQMFGIIGVAIFASMGLEAGYVGFALSYSLVRSILVVLSYRVGKHNKHTRLLNYFTAKTVAIAVVFWLLSTVADGAVRYTLMAIAIGIDLLAPILMAQEQRNVPINASHLSQRFGFFIIIMLGEILTAVTRSISTIGPSVRQLTLAALAIGLSFCIWWIYFENDYGPQVIKNFFTSSGRLLKKTIIAGYIWTYVHLPLNMGIMAVAVGIEHAIVQGPNANIAPERITLLSLGTIATLLSMGTMQIAAMQQEEKFKGLEHFKMLLPFLSAILILTLTKTVYTAMPITLLAGLVIISFAQVVLQEVVEHQLHTEHTPA